MQSKLKSSITTSIGNNQNSNPLDVINTRLNLQRLGLYDGETNLELADRNLIDAIKQLQQNEGLIIDGLMTPGGPTERALNRNLAGESNAFGDDPAELDLSNSVGQSQNNLMDDVIQLQRALATLDFMPASMGFEPNGIFDEPTKTGTRKFQKQNNLFLDGILHPGGETEAAMNNSLRMAVSDNEEDDGDEKGEAVPTSPIESEPLPGSIPPPPPKPDPTDVGTPLYPANVPDPDMDGSIVIKPDNGVNINPGWEI